MRRITLRRSSGVVLYHFTAARGVVWSADPKDVSRRPASQLLGQRVRFSYPHSVKGT